MKFRAFTRRWWKDNPDWPNGLEPESNGRRSYFAAEFTTEDLAREFCQKYNREHEPGKYSIKAEFEGKP